MKQKRYEDKYKTGEYALSSSQVKQLLLSFDSIFEKAIIHLAVSAGLRRNDIVNIKRNDLDVNSGKLTYYESKKSRTRTVKIPSADAINTLKMYVKIRDNTHPKNKWLFPSPLKTQNYRDKHISDRSIYNIFNEHLDIIGLDRRPFHSLRSTCIKLCDEANWQIFETAALVGDTVRVIEEHYLTPSKSQMEEIAELKQII